MKVAMGTVTDATSASSPEIQVDGETAKATPCLDSYTPVNADRVFVIVDGGFRLCIGKR
jgi:hypothetical protein